jgi:hypothetical protein
MQVPDHIQRLFAGFHVEGLTKPHHPIYYSWVFDYRTGEVHLSDDHHKERRHKNHHKDLSDRVGHPEKLHGYAYRIRDGWRLTDIDHGKITDRFIVGQVLLSINNEESNASTSEETNGDSDGTGVPDDGGSGVRSDGESGDSSSGGSSDSSSD